MSSRKPTLSGGGRYAVQDDQTSLEGDVQNSWYPVGLEGSWVPAEPKPNAAESRQYIVSVSFQMISECPSAAKLWSLLSLQVEDKQMQWLRKGEQGTYNLAPTLFLTHLLESSSIKFPLAGVEWCESQMRDNFARKLQEWVGRISSIINHQLGIPTAGGPWKLFLRDLHSHRL